MFFTTFFLLEYNKILQLLGFFIYKWNSINVEKEKNFKSFFIRDKFLIISKISVHNKMIISSVILMDLITWRNFKILLFIFLCMELLFFVKVLTPSVVIMGVITCSFLQQCYNEISIFCWKLVFLRFALIFNFNPIVERTCQIVEDELCSLWNSRFVDFFRINLVEEINIEFIKLIIVPNNKVCIQTF